MKRKSLAPKLSRTYLTARQLTDLLAARHAEDVFVPECKDGPTQGCEHLRLDAWAMAKSWSRPCVSGYEIKVARSDFNKDQKWHFYLPYCNVFYFVCPSGLIQPEELPPEAGLLWASTTGSRLFEKKKPRYREVTIPENLYRYILMGRVKVCQRYETPRVSAATYWKAWLERKEEDQDLGHVASRKIRQLVSKRVTDVEVEMRTMKAQMAQYDNLIEWLKSIGITSDGRVYAEYVKQKLQEKETHVPGWVLRNLENAISDMTQVLNGLSREKNGLG